eukprot:scaffold20249_cov63-Phaeocystis_antarctica.AAC.2
MVDGPRQQVVERPPRPGKTDRPHARVGAVRRQQPARVVTGLRIEELLLPLRKPLGGRVVVRATAGAGQIWGGRGLVQQVGHDEGLGRSVEQHHLAGALVIHHAHIAHGAEQPPRRHDLRRHACRSARARRSLATRPRGGGFGGGGSPRGCSQHCGASICCTDLRVEAEVAPLLGQRRHLPGCHTAEVDNRVRELVLVRSQREVMLWARRYYDPHGQKVVGLELPQHPVHALVLVEDGRVEDAPALGLREPDHRHVAQPAERLGCRVARAEGGA